MAAPKSKASDDRAPILTPKVESAYVDAFNAWSSAPPATRGAQPVAPVPANERALLRDIAISLRKLTGDEGTEDDAVKAYADQADGFRKLSAKVDDAKAKADKAVAEAEAQVAAAKAEAEASVAKAKGEKLDTEA